MISKEEYDKKNQVLKMGHALSEQGVRDTFICLQMDVLKVAEDYTFFAEYQNKEDPNISIVFSKTFTDNELQIEASKLQMH